jgi:lactoylglutathione lyase
MQTTSVTTGIPVRDLGAAQAWYAALLEHEHELEPAEGLAEFEVHPGSWLQLDEGAAEPAFRFGVPDIEATRERLVGRGIDVTPIETVEGVVKYCDFQDPDGNQLSLYQALA